MLHKTHSVETDIQPMSMAEYAALEARFGTKVVEQDGLYWRQVKPFFYRPLFAVGALAALLLRRARRGRASAEGR